MKLSAALPIFCAQRPAKLFATNWPNRPLSQAVSSVRMCSHSCSLAAQQVRPTWCSIKFEAEVRESTGTKYIICALMSQYLYTTQSRRVEGKAYTQHRDSHPSSKTSCVAATGPARSIEGHETSRVKGLAMDRADRAGRRADRLWQGLPITGAVPIAIASSHRRRMSMSSSVIRRAAQRGATT
jgi:hypothetical protein